MKLSEVTTTGLYQPIDDTSLIYRVFKEREELVVSVYAFLKVKSGFSMYYADRTLHKLSEFNEEVIKVDNFRLSYNTDYLIEVRKYS